MTLAETAGRLAGVLPASLAALPWRRIALTAGIAALAGVRSYMSHGTPSVRPSDFMQLQVAARVWLSGADPYTAIGPGLAFDPGFPLIYPFTAVMVAAPFALLPSLLPDVMFVVCGTALLLWAVTADARHRMAWFVVVSAALVTAVQMSQWSPLITGAALVPTFGFLLACKPTVGAALWIAYPSRRALVGAAMLVLVSLALNPAWPKGWLDALPTATHMRAPVMYWGGPLLLLAWLKWKRPEARLLGALALVPQTPVAYEAVPLFLIPRTAASAGLLCVLTWVAFFQYWGAGPPLEPEAYQTWMATAGNWMVGLVYLPCLGMILRRPNTAD